MNRAHFMAQLRDGLSGMHPVDIADITSDCESHFADGAADGRSEDEVAAALGDPARLARELRAEIGFKRWERDRSPGNFLAVVLALLGLATFDLMILLPLVLGVASIFLGLAIICLACLIGGVYLLFNLVPFHGGGVMDNRLMQLLTGTGLVSGSLGLGALLLMGTDAIARGLIRYARLHFRLFDTANNSL